MKAFKTEVKRTAVELTELKKTMGVCRYLCNPYLQKAKEHDPEALEFLSRQEFDTGYITRVLRFRSMCGARKSLLKLGRTP